MADDIGKIDAHIDFIPHLDKVRDAIREIARLEREAAGGAKEVLQTDRAPAAQKIASQVADLHRLQQRTEQSLRGQGQDPKAFSHAATTQLTQFVKKLGSTDLKLGANIDALLSREVAKLVDTKDARTRFTRAEDVQRGLTESHNLQNPDYRAGRANDLARRQADDEARRLAAARQSPDFKQSLLGVDVQSKGLFAEMSGLRLASAEYKQYTTQGIVNTKLLNTETVNAARAQRAYVEATAEAAASRKKEAAQSAVLQRGGQPFGLADKPLRDEAARVTRQEQLADTTRQRRGAARDPEEMRLRAEAEQSRRDMAAATALARRGESPVGLNARALQDRAAALARQESLSATTRQQRGAALDPEEMSMRAQARSATRAADMQSRLSDEGFQAEQENVAARRYLNQRILTSAAGYDDGDITRRGGMEAAAAQASFMNNLQRRANATSGLTDDEIREAAVLRANYAARNNAIKLHEKSILNQMIKEGQLGGTLTQRKLAMWSPGMRTPADVAPGMSNIKSKAITTLGYGASAVATGFLFQGITGAIQEASELENTFVRMEGQLTALGRAGDFEGVRDGIKNISTETGLAATDVAEFSSRMLGAFSDKSTAEVMKDTESAMKLMVVTGLDANTMMQSVIPTAKAFGVSIGEIGDIVVQSGEQLGANEEQMVEFLGKAAVVAKQTGMGMRELAIIGATMAQNVGTNLASSADTLNKMPALVAKNQSKIFDILEKAPATAAFVPGMQKDLAQGKGGAAYQKLLEAAALTPEQGGLAKEEILKIPRLAGNPKEIEDVTAQIVNATTIVERWRDAGVLAAKGSDAMETRFAKLANTVHQTFERLQRSIESFAESLFDLGLGDFFTTFGKSIEIALGSVGLFVKALTAINDVTKVFGLSQGLISPMIQAGVQVGILLFLFDRLVKLKQKFIPTNQAVAATEGEEAASRTTNATAAGREYAAVTAANTAKTAAPTGTALGAPTTLPTAMARRGVPIGRGFADSLMAQRLAGLRPVGPLPVPSAADMARLQAGQAVRGGGSTQLLGARAFIPRPAPVAPLTDMGRINYLGATGRLAAAGPGLALARGAGETGSVIGRNIAKEFGVASRNPALAFGSTAGKSLGEYTQRSANLFRANLTQGWTQGPYKASTNLANAASTMGTRMNAAAQTLARVREDAILQTARAVNPAFPAAAGGMSRGQIVASALQPGMGALRSLRRQDLSGVDPTSAMARLGGAGSSGQYASFLSRAASGGGTNMISSRIAPLRGLAAGGNAATAAAGTGQGIMGAGGMVVPALAIGLIAASQVKSAYDENKEKVQGAADSFTEQVKTANVDRLKEVVAGGHDIQDSIASKIFGTDLPDALAQAGIAYQAAKPQADLLAGLKATGSVDQFITRIQGSDPAKQALTDFFNQKNEQGEYVNRALAEELNVLGTKGDGLFGEYSEQTKAAKKYHQTSGGLMYGVTNEQIPDIVKRASEMMDSKQADIREQGSGLINALAGRGLLDSPEFADLKAKAAQGKASTAEQLAVEAEGGGAAAAAKDYDALKREFDAGKLPLGAFLAQAMAAREKAQSRLAGMTDDQRKEAQAEIDRMDSETRKMRDDSLQARVDSMISIAEMSGRDDVQQFTAEKYVQALPTFSKAEQLDKLPDILSKLQAGFDERIENIADPMLRAQERLKGFKIPDVVRRLMVETDIRGNEPVANGLVQLAPWFAKSTDDMVEWVAQQVLDTGMAAIDIVNKAMRERRKAVLDAVAGAGTGLMGLFKRGAAGIEADDILDQEAANILTMGGAQMAQLLGGAGGYFNSDARGMARMVAEKSAEWNLSTADTIKRILTERLELAKAAIVAAGGDPNNSNDPTIKFLEGLIASANNIPGGATPPPTESVESKRKNRRNDLAAIADVQKADVQNRSKAMRGDDLAQAQAGLDQAWIDYGTELKLQKEGLDDPAARKRAFGAVLDAQAAVEDARRESYLMRYDWAEFHAAGDPEAEVRAKLGRAEDELRFAIKDAGGNMGAASVQKKQLEIAKLQRDMEDAQLEVMRARSDVLSATFERDPVKTATIARDMANAELERARGTVDEQEKLAAKIRADHALEDAMSAVFESRAGLAIALAEVAGEPVRAAEIAAKEAKRKLDEAIAQGRGEAEINQLRGQFATATENWARTGRSDEEAIIDFQLAMGEITTSQAVDGLKLILSRTKVGTDEYRSLAQKIKGIEQQAGQDLQFNLPSNITLPTLYEARRVNQGTAAGIGYMDNRNIALTFNVNGSQDPAAVSSQIMGALQTAMGGGQLYTPGVAVGMN